MSKLKRQDFYCGAGLAVLFRKNKHISPSVIENVNDIEGKNVVGTFYKIKTESGNEAIIYIKFSSNQQTIKNLTKSWRFSLTDIEKNKIEKQIQKEIPFFIILIGVEQINKDNVAGEIALLTIDDYQIISRRTNIIMGLWSNNDDSKSERQKVYVFKIGKGNSREYFHEVKRKQIEEPIDDLIADNYPYYKKVQSETDDALKVNDFKKNLIEIYVTDKPKLCRVCNSKCTYKLITYQKDNQSQNKIDVAICPKCGNKYVNYNFYNIFIKGNKNSNISFIILKNTGRDTATKNKQYSKPMSGQSIRFLSLSNREDNICPIHNESMPAVYVHIGKTSDTVYYCSKCGKYMIPNSRHKQLIKNLGKSSSLIEFEKLLV